MFFHFLYPLAGEHSLFNVFKYITVRSFLAFILSVLISIFWGKRFIAYMKLKQFGQIVRSDGPESHKKKSGTPTFGGVFILGSIFITCFLTGNFSSLPFLFVLIVAAAYFCLGGLDDYLKVLKKNTDGVSARGKLAWQFATAGLISFCMIYFNVINSELYLPFMKGAVCDLGWGYVVFSSLVIVGSSNAVNLTDGLDGLAIGPIITSSAALGLLAYLCGHRELAQYLFIPHVPYTGELLIISAATIGAGIGFLWYNSYPAEIFMGDVGSLSLGGILGTTAVLTKNEFLFVIIGGIFVLEAVSVILQVASYKTRKKRIFKMAPIHHHFELLGWPEPKVIVRFWIGGLVLAIIALASLKLR
ncbi:MAG: phospho-N-acetylmuramoyl-pentapeptide-transferase [Bacteriovoracaceae bacterium]